MGSSLLLLLCGLNKLKAQPSPDKPLASWLDQHEILDSVQVDFDADGDLDLFLALYLPQTEAAFENRELEEPPYRRLLILEHTHNHLYRLQGVNYTLLMCCNCGGPWGDPYDGISFDDGRFTVAHFGGSTYRWVEIHSFERLPGTLAWYLVESIYGDVPVFEPEAESFDTTTVPLGEYPFATFNGWMEHE